MAVQIPVIDLCPLADPAHTFTEVEKRRCAEQLNAAFMEFGLAYITLNEINSMRSARISQCAIQAAIKFFGLSEGSKTSLTCDRLRPGVTRGYLGVGSESGGSCFEVKEAFSYSSEVVKDGKEPSNAMEAENIWPPDVCDGQTLRSALTEYFELSGQIMKLVARALAMTWTEDESDVKMRVVERIAWLEGMVEKGRTISLMRCFRYLPIRNTVNSETGSVEHTDWGFATLINQQNGTEAALQVMYKGRWLDIPPLPNTFVVNCGDFACLLSAGRLHSPLHRVILTKKERVSLVYFQYPEFNTRLPETTPSTVHLSIHQNQDEESQAQQKTREQNADLSFGEQIVRKWEQVRRSQQGT